MRKLKAGEYVQASTIDEVKDGVFRMSAESFLHEYMVQLFCILTIIRLYKKYQQQREDGKHAWLPFAVKANYC